jgi:hypothetical protein
MCRARAVRCGLQAERAPGSCHASGSCWRMLTSPCICSVSFFVVHFCAFFLCPSLSGDDLALTSPHALASARACTRACARVRAVPCVCQVRPAGRAGHRAGRAGTSGPCSSELHRPPLACPTTPIQALRLCLSAAFRRWLPPTAAPPSPPPPLSPALPTTSWAHPCRDVGMPWAVLLPSSCARR